MDAGYKQHLEILRAQHLELTTKYTDLLKNYDLIAANSPQNAKKAGLACGLIRVVKSLYKKSVLSDITLKVGGTAFKCHRFLLYARSTYWQDVEDEIFEVSDVTPDTIQVVYDWLYTDVLNTKIDDSVLVKVAEIAIKYQFRELDETCQLLLKSRLDVSNCVPIFEFADRYDLTQLRDCCASLVSARWNEFSIDHFSGLSATLLFKLLKGHSNDVLHSIIRLQREDVLFLYFVENDGKLKTLLNDGSSAPCALEAALALPSKTIAGQLIEHGANPNLHYTCGEQSSLLMQQVRIGNIINCCFLVEKGALVDGSQDRNGFSLVQRLAMSVITEDSLSFLSEISSDCNVNYFSPTMDTKENLSNCSALTLACLNEDWRSLDMINVLLAVGADVNLSGSTGATALFHALVTKRRQDVAKLLIEKAANVNIVVDRKPLIHHLINDKDMFLYILEFKPDLDARNDEGDSVIHCLLGLELIPHDILAASLKSESVNINITDSNGSTALHKAISIGLPAVETLLRNTAAIDFSIRDRNERTPLELALQLHGSNIDNIPIADALVKAGANVNENSSNGNQLLLHFLLKGNDTATIFLLSKKANHIIKDSTGRSCLEIALSSGMSGSVHALCATGVNINERSSGGTGFCVLERALSEGHIECAGVLAKYGCDLESWTMNDGVEQTLLHHMLDNGKQEAAVFLIKRNCDVNALKRFTNVADDERHTPLHTAVTWGLTDVVKELVQSGANLIAQDIDGRTPAHLAVREGNSDALSVLLASNDVTFIGTRDKVGQTPLSLAISKRDHKMAAEIVNRLPHAALQVNGNGENLLHIAVRTNDLESVLFLLGTHTDPTKTTQDSARRTALHMSATVENELIMRNLILAGCVVNARSTDGCTALHEAVRANRPDLVLILLENQADPNIPDEKGENAILTAVRSGSLSCVNCLLSFAYPSFGCVKTWTVNQKGQTALHICALLTMERMEKGATPAEICDVLMKYKQDVGCNEKELAAYIDAQDSEGNTALLSAYMAGNAAVCRCLLRRAATMGAKNSEGVSVFTQETPTKQLLFGLLESLEREPRWSDGDVCDCGTKFSITQRKHHCRHCGRVVCSACSPVNMPIVKFSEEKKVRVCNMCSLVLTQGAPR